MARKKSKLVHIDKDGVTHEVSKEVGTNKFFIKNTDIDVTGRVTQPKYIKNGKVAKAKENYDFSKPMDAQDLGDEWDDYAWGGSDF